MKEYRDNNNSSKHRQHEKSRLQARHVFMASFFMSLCCVAALAINLLVNNFSQSADNGQPSIPLSPGVVIAADYNSATAAYDAQNNGFESAPADDAIWHLVLVNRWNLIPEDYEVELTELANGQLVDARIYPALQDMFDAARGDGVYPVVVSGYRTTETQQRLLDEKIAEYRAGGCSATEAGTKAQAWVAIPGSSEHQLGIAVDINADGIHSAGYEVYDWLEQNARKYGFICRYPADKTEITGVIGEAWHYRYVGIEAATEIYNQDVCLEEYLNSIT